MHSRGEMDVMSGCCVGTVRGRNKVACLGWVFLLDGGQCKPLPVSAPWHDRKRACCPLLVFLGTGPSSGLWIVMTLAVTPTRKPLRQTAAAAGLAKPALPTRGEAAWVSVAREQRPGFLPQLFKHMHTYLSPLFSWENIRKAQHRVLSLLRNLCVL